MQINLEPSWKNILSDEFEKPYFKNLIAQLEQEYEENSCFPPKNLIFASFDFCSFNDIKVVIIGQDPYHGEGEANGLCFSVNDGVKIPPSLRNIYKELNEDVGVEIPISGNLERWAKQGVLLLNAGLSVRKDQANSHKHLKWNVFTDVVIQKINEKKEGVVFLLWGNFAHKKGAKIDAEKNLVLKSGHPSPMSANQGKWFGNKHFSQANAYLKSKGKKEIEW